VTGMLKSRKKIPEYPLFQWFSTRNKRIFDLSVALDLFIQK